MFAILFGSYGLTYFDSSGPAPVVTEHIECVEAICRELPGAGPVCALQKPLVTKSPSPVMAVWKLGNSLQQQIGALMGMIDTIFSSPIPTIIAMLMSLVFGAVIWWFAIPQSAQLKEAVAKIAEKELK